MTFAGLPYFSPHKFRRAVIAEARKYCRTEEQRKALGQNVGHDNIGTTFTYGNMSASQVNEVILSMKFQPESIESEALKVISTDDLLKEIQSRTKISFIRFYMVVESEKRFLKIKEAASYLGVTAQTLRNWDKAGKLKPQRHPMNNYRVYSTDELNKIMKMGATKQ